MIELHRETEGRPGLDGTKELTTQALTALAIIDDARAARLKDKSSE